MTNGVFNPEQGEPSRFFDYYRGIGQQQGPTEAQRFSEFLYARDAARRAAFYNEVGRANQQASPPPRKKVQCRVFDYYGRMAQQQVSSQAYYEHLAREQHRQTAIYNELRRANEKVSPPPRKKVQCRVIEPKLLRPAQ